MVVKLTDETNTKTIRTHKTSIDVDDEEIIELQILKNQKISSYYEPLVCHQHYTTSHPQAKKFGLNALILNFIFGYNCCTLKHERV